MYKSALKSARTLFQFIWDRYDTESGLYYIQSRYYNPDWGRFINADSEIGKPGRLLSHNLFAYSGNNPVNLYDPDGKAWALLAALYFVPGVGEALMAATLVVVAVALTGAVVYEGYKVYQKASEKSRAEPKAIPKVETKKQSVTVLYRAMSYIEYNRLVKNGRFTSDQSMDAKWFAKYYSDAKRWENLFYPYGGSVIVAVTVLTASLRLALYNPRLDSIEPAYCYQRNVINAVMLNYTRVR